MNDENNNGQDSSGDEAEDEDEEGAVEEKQTRQLGKGRMQLKLPLKKNLSKGNWDDMNNSPRSSMPFLPSPRVPALPPRKII